MIDDFDAGLLTGVIFTSVIYGGLIICLVI